MIYENIRKGIFLSRPNRFIAQDMINGNVEKAHVKNTGRCRELLVEGAPVYLQQHAGIKRKTALSLIGVEKGSRLVNIDSQAPNRVIHEWLLEGKLLRGIRFIKPEFTYGGSRFDFFVETDRDKVLIEVKGVTLEEDNIALFPDAPTERGVRHVFELCDSINEGYSAYILFVIQMEGVRYFTPNARTHQAFADALKYAEKHNVKIMAVDCEVCENSLKIAKEVAVVI